MPGGLEFYALLATERVKALLAVEPQLGLVLRVDVEQPSIQTVHYVVLLGVVAHGKVQ